MSCPLCDLSNQEIVYQDDYCYGVVILEPLKDGHLMILPKRHVTDLSNLNSNETKAIFTLLGRLEKAIQQEYREDPIIFMNRGKWSTQPHIHFHILPSKGGLRHLFAGFEKIPFRTKATAKEMKAIGDKIRNKLE